MFTGIVQALRPVVGINDKQGGRRLTVSLGPISEALAQNVQLGMNVLLFQGPLKFYFSCLKKCLLISTSPIMKYESIEKRINNQQFYRVGIFHSFSLFGGIFILHC
jgi:hypothetical protein